MKAASAATLAILAGNQFMMAELYTITLLNGTVLRYTDADGDLQSSLGGVLQQSGIAQAAASSSLTLSAAASAVQDAYAGMAVRIAGGTGAGQERRVFTSRQNLQKYSDSLSTSPWAAAASIAKNAIGRDGTANSAWTLTNNYLKYNGISAISGQVYTRSFYVKKTIGVQPSYTVFSVEFAGKIGLITLDPSNGIATAWTAYSGWTIIPITARCTSCNAFWRVEMVFTAPISGNYDPVIYVGSAGSNPSQSSGMITVSGTGTIVVQDFQSELGATATEYIHTEANPAVGVAVDTPWVTQPDATSTYEIDSYQTYAATSPKVLRDRTKLTVGIEVDTMAVTLYAGINDLIQGVPFPQFVNNGGFDGARVQVDRCFMLPYGDTSAGVVNIFTGSVSDVKPSRTEILLTVSSDLQLLNIPMPRNVYAPACSHNLYDAGCGASKAAFGAASSCAAGTTALQIVCALAQAASYFDTGTITFTGGQNAGATRTVKSYVPGVISLSLPLPYAPAVGDTFTAYAGCDKTQATCAAKFNRLSSFRGFPYIPVPEASL